MSGYICKAMAEDNEKTQVWLGEDVYARVVVDKKIRRPRVRIWRPASKGQPRRCVYAEAVELDFRMRRLLAVRQAEERLRRLPLSRSIPRVQIEKIASRECIVMNLAIRDRLDLEKDASLKGNVVRQCEIPGDLKIEMCKSLPSRCWAGLVIAYHHPQVIVRCSFWLGVLGVVLGVLGVMPDCDEWAPRMLSLVRDPRLYVMFVGLCMLLSAGWICRSKD